MRIAIFQIDWSIQSYTRDLINGLVELGHEVELLTTGNSIQGFIDMSSIKGPIHCLASDNPYYLLYRNLRAKIASVFNFPLVINCGALNSAAKKFLSTVAAYDLFIGIEKSGLDLATTCAEKTGTPCVYYSLELYLEDHYAYRRFGWQRRREIECHSRASATIVQDRHRWLSLQRANGIKTDNVFYLPVGVRGKANLEIAQERLEGASCFKVLYFGNISRDRYSYDLMSQAEHIPKGVVVHLHGPITDKSLLEIVESQTPSNFIITTHMIPEADLFKLIRSANVGLSLYRIDNDNDKYTAYSSQKVAIYLQFGLPIIAFRTSAYEELLSNYKCGEMIESMDQLSSAIKKIEEDYDSYVDGARRAYDEVYNLDIYWKPLSDFLEASVGLPRS